MSPKSTNKAAGKSKTAGKKKQNKSQHIVVCPACDTPFPIDITTKP